MPVIRKVDMFRAPMRLGEDAFIHGRISENRTEDLIKIMVAFKNLMEVCRPEDYMACATSALRVANNGQRVVERIRKETGINIRITEGDMEARLIALNRVSRQFGARAYLYIDVGGGTTELTLYADGQAVDYSSFDIGTVRLKENLVADAEWESMRHWVRSATVGYRPLAGIGSGGYINKIFKLTRKRRDKPLSADKLRQIHSTLKFLSYEDRMLRLGLRPDRADVIVPAGKIFLHIMKWSGIEQLYVPQIGLADGIIHYLYRKHRGVSATA
ncbi:MAG: exopolyphosphatase [Magnetococcales bacterium]|nr:exopolyphosphatase [Magnetococcales bacterium]